MTFCSLVEYQNYHQNLQACTSNIDFLKLCSEPIPPTSLFWSILCSFGLKLIRENSFSLNMLGFFFGGVPEGPGCWPSSPIYKQITYRGTAQARQPISAVVCNLSCVLWSRLSLAVSFREKKQGATCDRYTEYTG